MPKHTLYLFRVALAFAFLYPAIAGLINPINWIGYLPTFVINLAPFPAGTLLVIFEIIEIIVGLWLLFGRNIFWPSAAAALMLFGIVVSNFHSIDVIFRDIALLFVAGGLLIYYYKNNKSVVLSINNKTPMNPLNKRGNGLAWLLVIIAIAIILLLVLGGNKEAKPQPIEEDEFSEETAKENIPVDGILENIPLTVVTYTDSGFEPKEVKVGLGEVIRFVNSSSHDMWIASATHPSHAVYDGTSLSEHCPNPDDEAFDQCESVSSSSFWEFTFNKVGEWGYHNHVRANDFGKVIVE